MKAAVHTRYGPPDVVRIAEVDTPTIRDDEVLVKVHATTVNRTDCALPGGQAFLRAIRSPGSSATGDGPGERVRGSGRGGRRRRHVVRGRRPGVRIQRGPVRCPCRIPGRCPRTVRSRPCRRTVTYEEAAPSTEGAHYALALIRKAKIQQRAGRAGQRRDRSHRLGGGPAVEESRRQRDRGLRHGPRGTGQGLGRRPGHRLHGPGLHHGRAELRRGPRRGRQEFVRSVQPAVETGRDLRLVGAGSAGPESVPGARHSAAGGKKVLFPIPQETRRWCGISRS